VIDRLRAYLNRPIRDSERRRLFAVAAAVIVAAAVGLTLAAGDEGAQPTAPTKPRTTRPVAAAPPPTELPDEPAQLPVPSEEGPRPVSEQPARTQIAAAKRATRAFLAGYLPYTYGRARAAGIPGATAELRRRSRHAGRACRLLSGGGVQRSGHSPFTAHARAAWACWPWSRTADGATACSSPWRAIPAAGR
jgi:hypothetical protein